MEKELKSMSAELLEKFQSSSNLAISLVSIPLNWHKPNEQKHLFTTPCIVLADSISGATDGNIRMSMATIRDVLRRGRCSMGAKEGKETTVNPQVLSSWGRSPRELFMSELDSSEVVEKGKYSLKISCILCFGLVGKVNTGDAGCTVAPVVSGLRQEYRVFARGDRLI